jgi:hypothetical protein
MRTLLTVLALATAACNGCGAATSTAVERQTAPAVACLPIAAVAILACVQAHDEGCVIVKVAELVSCWATHQPPSSSPPDASAPAAADRAGLRSPNSGAIGRAGTRRTERSLRCTGPGAATTDDAQDPAPQVGELGRLL